MSAPPIKVILTDVGPHETLAFPLWREGVTISGPSGAGKSTIASLLCWLFTGLTDEGVPHGGGGSGLAAPRA